MMPLEGSARYQATFPRRKLASRISHDRTPSNLTEAATRGMHFTSGAGALTERIRNRRLANYSYRYVLTAVDSEFPPAV
jgi:hypothetical protein